MVIADHSRILQGKARNTSNILGWGTASTVVIHAIARKIDQKLLISFIAADTLTWEALRIFNARKLASLPLEV